jgi:2-dehydropantoate 2-reductase
VCGSAADAAAGGLIARAKAEGIAYASGAEITELRSGTVDVQPLPGEPTRSSTWQSLARGAGSIKMDYLNGEIVLLGRAHGVPTPVNAALTAAARESVLLGRNPGVLPADALIRRIEAAATA